MSIKICFGSQKGGVGKTTLLFQVAINLIKTHNHKVIIANGDTQLGVNVLFHNRQKTNEKINLSAHENNLTLIKLNEFTTNYKYYNSLDDSHIILIDTHGDFSLGGARMISMNMVDLVVSPIPNKFIDLITIKDIADIMRQYKLPYNKIAFVFNMLNKSSRGNYKNKIIPAIDLINTLFENQAHILNSNFKNSSYYEKGNEKGLSVLDYKHKKLEPLHQEIIDVTQEILSICRK